ncbi:MULTISPECIES: tail fiber assembly protein [unclassified Pseudomonas]|uniref:tail fiber assembly protein n=1 Tax=unclassified Pseudomonas TaxID=196821 RepID=UPI00244A4566|nr:MULTISPECIES: tail fiber assembly protein [unclassified Pseudomonas]MDH0300614.1 tail fiber assembly protein [Pseudomonas sp. GD04091]MDH1984235.1 tail fiber assembly protein [Pseudomonas sp. GD03689]
MRISLSPQRRDDSLIVFRDGETLSINSVKFDFADLPDGATLPAGSVSSHWVFGDVERSFGELRITLLLPHAGDAPAEARFPAPVIDPPDGAVVLPGLPLGQPGATSPGAIDWSAVVTAEAKAQAAAAELLAGVIAETGRRRRAADEAIAPLQDAADLDEATQAEALRLKDWKRYRVALNRLPDQPGYPATIDWPAPPA